MFYYDLFQTQVQQQRTKNNIEKLNQKCTTVMEMYYCSSTWRTASTV